MVNWDEEAIYGHGFDLEEGVTGLKRATALLPLSPDRKDDVLGWEMEIDARDPFLAWSFIQYQGEKALQRRKERTVPGSRNDEELMGLWRDSLIEVNYRKVARALKSCRLDREKIDMWRWWLGLEVIPAAAEEEEQELHEREGGITAGESVMRAPNAKPNTGVDAKSWKAGERRPNISDVWDLIEGRVRSCDDSDRLVCSPTNLLTNAARTHSPSLRIPTLAPHLAPLRTRAAPSLAHASPLPFARSWSTFRAGSALARTRRQSFGSSDRLLYRRARAQEVLRGTVGSRRNVCAARVEGTRVKAVYYIPVVVDFTFFTRIFSH